MSLLSRGELRIGVCPARLVVVRGASREIVPTGDDRLAALKELAGSAPVAVVVSNHFARYCLLSSTALSSDADWLAYARHALTATYGAEATNWDVRVTRTDSADSRIACALDPQLADALRALPGLRSMQPYLMAACNPRRPALRNGTAWLVLHEPGRLVIAFLDRGAWRVLRARQAKDDWVGALADLLDREAAIAGTPSCDRVLVCAEEEVPSGIGRYQAIDISGAASELRPYLMTLH